MSDTRQHVHELVDQLDAGQLAAVGQLLEVMTDPVARSLANAPPDDEPYIDQQKQRDAEAESSISRGEGVSHEDVLREFGL